MDKAMIAFYGLILMAVMGYLIIGIGLTMLFYLVNPFAGWVVFGAFMLLTAFIGLDFLT